MAARVAVVGGGPGGLVAALALARRGVAVTVFERAAGYAPTSGGGFGLAFNGSAALKAISPSVHAAVARVSTPFAHWSLGDGRGGIAREMRDVPMLRMDDGSPALAGALRAEVLAVLRAALPAGALVLGADVTAVTPGGDGRGATVTVRRRAVGGSDTAATATTDTHEFDAVVAADGVRSRVRAQLWPRSGTTTTNPPPVYSGAEVFYGVPRPSPQLLDTFEYAGDAGGGGWVHQSAGVGRAFITAGCRVDATAAAFGLPGPSAGCYYGFTRAKSAAEAGLTAAADGGHWDEAAVTTTGSGTGTGAGLTVSGQAAKDDLWREVRDGAWGAWGRAVVDATPTERLLRFPMFWRLPPSKWHVGRVALMGDAAHTPLPTAGQGLNMAVEGACLDGRLAKRTAGGGQLHCPCVCSQDSRRA
jgi:2-polyprenyl-6-methoxyphenol hydroxylase-like FAD-dependent oxidoreductase